MDWYKLDWSHRALLQPDWCNNAWTLLGIFLGTQFGKGRKKKRGKAVALLITIYSLSSRKKSSRCLSSLSFSLFHIASLTLFYSFIASLISQTLSEPLSIFLTHFLLLFYASLLFYISLCTSLSYSFSFSLTLSFFF
jgi:hypothetical protein